MGLSEARGLVLFRVVRGGIGVTQRLGATGTVSSTGHCHTHPRTRASQEPIGHHQRRSPEMEGLFTRDAQAACDFSFSASKFSPFFHRVSVIAAILRASVRRAMVGLMPLASAAWYKSWNGPGRILAMVAAPLNRPFRSWLWSLSRPEWKAVSSNAAPDLRPSGIPH